MFQQVPLVEMDGMKLIQSKAILHYIAGKYNMFGKDLKERVMYDSPCARQKCLQCSGSIGVISMFLMLSLRIDMYSEGLIDLMEMIMMLIFTEDAAAQKENILNKAKNRYLPIFEKVPLLTVHIT